MEMQVSAFEILPYLFYPMFLLISSLIFIFLIPERKKYQESKERENRKESKNKEMSGAKSQSPKQCEDIKVKMV